MFVHRRVVIYDINHAPTARPYIDKTLQNQISQIRLFLRLAALRRARMGRATSLSGSAMILGKNITPSTATQRAVGVAMAFPNTNQLNQPASRAHNAPAALRYSQ